MAKLINAFDVFEPDEYEQYGITPDVDFQELMDIYQKSNRVDKRVVNNLVRLMNEEIKGNHDDISDNRYTISQEH